MNEIGWGVVGCSDIVERRAGEAIRRQGRSRLIAFHSRDRRRAEAFGATFGAPSAYDRLDDLLADDRIGVVYVATEVDRHAEIAIAAAEAGKHVLVEKPMALTADECRAMIAAAERNGVQLSVAYYVRFFEKSAVMRRLIEEGALGRVVRATVTQISYVNPDPADPKYWRVAGRGGGNVLADVGSHRIDLLSYWLGRPRRVAGLADRLSQSYAAPDTETALVQFAAGTHVTVLANANVPRSGRSTAGPGNPAGQTSIEVYGTHGSLLTDPWSDAPVEVVGTDLPPIQCTRPENAHAPLIDDFATAIVEGRKPRFSGTDGMWATAVIDGVRESAHSGRFVEIGEGT